MRGSNQNHPLPHNGQYKKEKKDFFDLVSYTYRDLDFNKEFQGIKATLHLMFKNLKYIEKRAHGSTCIYFTTSDYLSKVISLIIIRNKIERKKIGILLKKVMEQLQ